MDERPGNLDELLLADGQRLDESFVIHHLPQSDHDVARARALGSPVERSPRGEPFAAQEQVVRHREGRNELQLLVNDGDAAIRRITRGPQDGIDTVEAHVARRRPLDACEDLDQRGLAGAVLADQGVHVARQQPEVDAVERHRPRIGLGHAGRFQHARDGRCNRRHRGAFSIVRITGRISRGPF